MENKLALWSWLLPTIAFGIIFIIYLIALGGSVAFAILFIYATYLLIICSILGLIFAIISFKRISKNKKLPGETSTKAGLGISGLLILIEIILFIHRLIISSR